MNESSSTAPDSTPANYKALARQQVIESKLPAWVSTAKPEIHQGLRAAIDAPPTWLAQARSRHPQILRTLAQDYAAHRRCEAELAALLAKLPGLEAFALDVLGPAVKQRFGLDLDVSNTYLLNARKAVEYKQSFDQDPIVDGQRALKLATQSLLRCAMQNFEASEAQPGGMDADSLHAVILDSDEFLVAAATGKALPIAADQFAALARELDIGGQYQALIEATWESAPAGLLSDSERYAFRVHAHLAYLQETLSEAMYEALLALSLDNPASYQGSPLHCNFVTFWERQLTGALIIGVPPYRGALVCYLPGAPTPLKEYPSVSALMAELPAQLLKVDLSHLQRLLPARYHDEVMGKLLNRLRPLEWDPATQHYVASADPTAQIRVGMHYFTLPFLETLANDKYARLKDDAAFHAVPTASEDQLTAQKRKAYFIQKLFMVLNTGAFFVPGLGEVMMGVTVFQLGFEIFDGLESWTNDDREQALGYLVDVAENVALIAALGAAGAEAGTPAVERIPVETPSFIEALKPVEMPNGKTRLWRPDLAPFAHDIVLPAGLKPDEFGLYHHEGKTWLALEDKVYSASPTAQGHVYRLEHPTDATRYQPIARHNGAGTWQHELDRPLEWQGHRLVRRTNLYGATLDAVTAQRVLRVSDTSETVLRSMYSDNLRPPALFEDTLERFRLDEQVKGELPSANAETQIAAFEAYNQALHGNPSGPARAIRQAYPGIPGGIAEEVARHANPDELLQLQAGKVPLRLSEEVRIYQQHVRLQRAYEGLYLQSVRSNPDTEVLILHSLERLPEWPPQVRIEVRDRWFGGRLLDAIGTEEAATRKILVRHDDGFEVFDRDGQNLSGRDNLYASVLHALPDAARTHLGFPGVWQGQGLEARLLERPLMERPALRQLLKMQPRQPARNSPMRLADGRIGYPLSGRGVTSEFILRDTLLDMIRLLGLPRRLETAEQLLGELERTGLTRQQIHDRLCQLLSERSALSARLDAWGDASSAMVDLDRRAASRSRMLEAIWQHWSQTALPELGRADAALRFEQVLLIDLPSGLPDFFLSRVRNLQIIDSEVSGLPGTFEQMADDARTLDEFCQRFPRVTALEFSRSTVATRPSLTAIQGLDRIGEHFPGLRTLNLRNQGCTITMLDIDHLRGLRHLEQLELSGNGFSHFIGQDFLHGLPLRVLRLDRTGLDSWPAWLDDQALSSLQHLSLRDNHLTGVPDRLISNALASPPNTVIALQGNPIQSGCLRQILLRDNAVPRRFSFEVDDSAGLRDLFDHYRQLNTELRQILASWEQAPSSAASSGDKALIRDALMTHLQRLQLGESRAPLTLEAIDLACVPPHLPDAYLRQVQDLRLVGLTNSVAQLDAFLARFWSLRSLTLENFTLATEALPERALTALPELRQLNLRNLGMQIDQRAIEVFARMRNLVSLELDGNRMGEISSVSGLDNHLQSLSLANVGLLEWPAWVEGLLPMRTLDLDDNLITDLPDHILYNPRNSEGQTEISLCGNPLSENTMHRAHTSERFQRSYTFNMDLPESIANDEWRDRHDSDTEEESSSDGDAESGHEGHLHSPPVAYPQGMPSVEPWLLGSVEENEVRRSTWQTLAEDEDAQDLLGLTVRLAEAAPYRNRDTRVDFANRVWQVLDVAAANAQQRQLFNVIAQEGTATCPDGAWLLLNQMEVRVFTEQAVRDAPAQSRGAALYHLTLRLYRLHELDDIARAQAGSRDEAEVRLAYRLQWAQQLELPLPPSSMLFRSHANLRRGELDDALAQVQRGEHGDPFIRYAVGRDFWVDYLKEAHTERFTALEQDYRQRVLAVPDEHPGQTIEQLKPVYDDLEHAYRAELARLIRELTIREGRARMPH